MVNCKVEGCEAPVKTRGWCVKHYSRWIRHGDPMKVMRGSEAPIPTEKQCKDCDETKSIEDFYLGNKGMKGGRSSYCRPCNRKRQYAWREANPERWQATQRRHGENRKPERPGRRRERDYNLPAAEYKVMLEKQGGGCAICGGGPSGKGKELHVDHDHDCCPGIGSCGQCIRGLLCSRCNTMIGLAKEDPERLLAAVRYLRAAERRDNT